MDEKVTDWRLKHLAWESEHKTRKRVAKAFAMRKSRPAWLRRKITAWKGAKGG